MGKKDNTLLGEVTDSFIIGVIAYEIIKGIASIIKIIGLIIFWPIALLKRKTTEIVYLYTYMYILMDKMDCFGFCKNVIV